MSTKKTIVVAGMRKTGKTRLIRSLAGGHDEIGGFDINFKEINPPFEDDAGTIFKGSGILLVFNLKEVKTLGDLEKNWVSKLTFVYPDMPVYLVGTTLSDVGRELETVLPAAAAQVAKRIGARSYFKITKENIGTSGLELLRKITRK